MRVNRRRFRPALSGSLVLLLFCLTLPAWSAEKARLRVDDYQIEAELNPHQHKITARAKVKFSALDDLSVATSNSITRFASPKVTDANNKPLSAERVTQDSSVRIR